MFDVRAHFGKWILVGAMAAAPVGAEVIFEENFDDQPDWHSAMHSSDGTQRATTHIIPEGWYSIRQDPTWAPSERHPDRHESIEILESNSDKARGGKGKSMVSWRDSHDPGWNRWNSGYASQMNGRERMFPDCLQRRPNYFEYRAGVGSRRSTQLLVEAI